MSCPTLASKRLQAPRQWRKPNPESELVLTEAFTLSPDHAANAFHVHPPSLAPRDLRELTPFSDLLYTQAGSP